MSSTLVLPDGYHDAKRAILAVAIVGELFQGGLMFGWNALAIMIVALGNFKDGCPELSESESGLCKTQESRLALLWTVGIFALNCGPVIMGFVLDFLGPKFTGILGVLLNILGLILFGISRSDGINAFVPAAIILGLGGITFHLAQFHISALYPRQRGLISAVFVAGFTGCGIMIYFLQMIFQAAGSTRGAYQAVLLGYAGILALWVPLIAWMMPNDSFRVGVVYLFNKDWRFEVRNRSELGALSYRRATSLQDFVAASYASQMTARGREHTQRFGQRGIAVEPAPQQEHAAAELVSYAIPSSSHPMWSEQEESNVGEESLQQPDTTKTSFADEQHSGVEVPSEASRTGEPADGIGRQPASPNLPSVEAAGFDGVEIGPESLPLPSDVVWGPLVFEARRFVELRKKSFKNQFFSSESFGMGIFYTLNVFIMQFYLGTLRLQLEHKGDSNHAYTNFGNISVAFAFLTIPVIGWLLDKKGYGWTLGTITTLSVLTSTFQALPVLQLQVISILLWMMARFFMYSSYFAIFGALFGFRNFGRLVAIDNTFNGLFGLLQYPLTYLAINPLNGNFTAINIGQVVVLLPLFTFCYYMYRWEREDLVPIRPMEGEELPIDMLGPRSKRKYLKLHWPHLPNFYTQHGNNVNDPSLAQGMQSEHHSRNTEDVDVR